MQPNPSRHAACRTKAAAPFAAAGPIGPCSIASIVARSVVCLGVTLCATQTLAQANLPPLPGTVTGALNLNMSANAYHDNQYFSDMSSDGRVLARQLLAQDSTTYVDPVGTTVASSFQQATSRASVDHTSIKLYSKSQADSWTSSPAYSAFATAASQAYALTPFMVQGGGASGSAGTLVATLLVTGSVTVGGPGFYNFANFSESRGQAYMYFWATGLNASGCTYHTTAGCLDVKRDYTGDTINSNNPVQSWTVNIPFTFDNVSTFSLQMWTSADSFVTAPLHGGAVSQQSESDFENTLRWGGIQAVLDDQGRPVSGWGIRSLPGVDLTVAVVPEPGTWAMMLGGLLAVGWIRRSRHARLQAAMCSRAPAMISSGFAPAAA